LHVWGERNNLVGASDHPLLAFAKGITLTESPETGIFDFKVPVITALEYVTQLLCWIRLIMLEDAGDGFNPSAYWENNVLLLSLTDECWSAHRKFEWNGDLIAKAISTPLDADPDSEEFKTASQLVWSLLRNTSMEKIYRGKGLTNKVTLGILLDKPEFADLDCKDGTFAELLRYGTSHFQQTRQSVSYVPALPSPVKMKKGLFEP